MRSFVAGFAGFALACSPLLASARPASHVTHTTVAAKPAPHHQNHHRHHGSGRAGHHHHHPGHGHHTPAPKAQ